MKAGPAALCFGKVWHRRNRPAIHEFIYGASHVWLDPMRPEELTSLSPLWSSERKFAPVAIRRSDFGSSSVGDLNDELRSKAEGVLGYQPSGPIRMLSQPRRWGWLFNPISIFVLWHDDPNVPVAVVSEVTNTPWKERTHYVLKLAPVEPSSKAPGATAFRTEFDKTLHVSPFLDMDYFYRLTLESDDQMLSLRIDVCPHDESGPIVETVLKVERVTATRKSLLRSAFIDGLRTRQVSAGIHAQAAKLTAKRVPFVSHPKRLVATNSSSEDISREEASK